MVDNKRLYRSRSDRQIAGVCGGIAEYLNVDPTLVRIAFVIGTLLGGPGLLLYIILAIVVPEEADLFYTPDKPKREQEYEV